jgi:butyrate kinase
MTHWILVINPGSTSTKLALFEDETMWASETLRHSPEDLAPVIVEQLDFRAQLAEKWLNSVFAGDKLSAVVARGGMLKSIPGGTYQVNELMREDLRKGVQGQHASNLGGLIAWELARKRGIPAFIVDPVSVDEMIPEAKISGLPEIQRRSSSHALNIRAIARRAARDLGQDLKDINLIMVHLGGGISVSPLRGGPFPRSGAGGCLPAIWLNCVFPASTPRMNCGKRFSATVASQPTWEPMTGRRSKPALPQGIHMPS